MVTREEGCVCGTTVELCASAWDPFGCSRESWMLLLSVRLQPGLDLGVRRRSVSGAQRESETASCVAARLALHFRVVPQGRGPCALS